MSALPVEYCPLNRGMFAKVIAASISSVSNIALYTVHLRYPRIIHGEVMTHRVFGRNARSSRAVPVKTMLNEVRSDSFVPWHWTGNKPGMQGVEGWDQKLLLKGNAGLFADNDVPVPPDAAWLWARDFVCDMAESYADAGYHKQVVNRLLEPFSWIDVLITATDWNNFFHLRDHGDAEPHMQDLARVTEKAILRTQPKVLEPGEWHLPYITEADWEEARQIKRNPAEQLNFLWKVSAARCARISYAPFDGDASYDRELARYDMLVGSDRIHASPLEHQATPDTQSFCRTFTDFGDGSTETVEGMAFDNNDLHGNLRGWIQRRKMVRGEAVYG